MLLTHLMLPLHSSPISARSPLALRAQRAHTQHLHCLSLLHPRALNAPSRSCLRAHRSSLPTRLDRTSRVQRAHTSTTPSVSLITAHTCAHAWHLDVCQQHARTAHPFLSARLDPQSHLDLYLHFACSVLTRARYDTLISISHYTQYVRMRSTHFDVCQRARTVHRH